MQQKNPQESFALLAKVAEKLMKTYSEIKALCDVGLKEDGGNNAIGGNVNGMNQIKTVNNNNVVRGSSADQALANKKTEGKQLTNKQQNTNQQPVQTPKDQAKSIQMTKQKIGNNMNRLQEKMSKIMNNDNDKKAVKKSTSNAGSTSYLLYFQERQPEISAKYPNLSITEICQKITDEWQSLDNAKKQSYQKVIKAPSTNSALPPKLKLENQVYKAPSKTATKNVEVKKTDKQMGKKRKGSISEPQADEINYVSEGQSDIEMMEDIYNEEQDEEIENS